jgi:hypothetical protein
MLTRIYHKKNEQFNIEFFQDKECRQAFNFENVKNLYIELEEGDCTPIFKLSNKLWSLKIKANIFTPAWYLGLYDGISSQTLLITLQDLENMDFSKYIPTDNAILFLNKDDADKYVDKCEAWFLYQENLPTRELNSQMDIRDYKKITIFIENYTESEIKKTIDIAKNLKEEYGVEEVNVFALHCFHHFYSTKESLMKKEKAGYSYVEFINKLITTNSTGILLAENKENLQVIDCYDIFNDYLKTK